MSGLCPALPPSSALSCDVMSSDDSGCPDSACSSPLQVWEKEKKTLSYREKERSSLNCKEKKAPNYRKRLKCRQSRRRATTVAALSVSPAPSSPSPSSMSPFSLAQPTDTDSHTHTLPDEGFTSRLPACCSRWQTYQHAMYNLLAMDDVVTSLHSCPSSTSSTDLAPWCDVPAISETSLSETEEETREKSKLALRTKTKKPTRPFTAGALPRFMNPRPVDNNPYIFQHYDDPKRHIEEYRIGITATCVLILINVWTRNIVTVIGRTTPVPIIRRWSHTLGRLYSSETQHQVFGVHIPDPYAARIRTLRSCLPQFDTDELLELARILRKSSSITNPKAIESTRKSITKIHPSVKFDFRPPSCLLSNNGFNTVSKYLKESKVIARTAQDKNFWPTESQVCVPPKREAVEEAGGDEQEEDADKEEKTMAQKFCEQLQMCIMNDVSKYNAKMTASKQTIVPKSTSLSAFIVSSESRSDVPGGPKLVAKKAESRGAHKLLAKRDVVKVSRVSTQQEIDEATLDTLFSLAWDGYDLEQAVSESRETHGDKEEESAPSQGTRSHTPTMPDLLPSPGRTQLRKDQGTPRSQRDQEEARCPQRPKQSRQQAEPKVVDMKSWAELRNTQATTVRLQRCVLGAAFFCPTVLHKAEATRNFEEEPMVPFRLPKTARTYVRD